MTKPLVVLLTAALVGACDKDAASGGDGGKVAGPDQPKTGDPKTPPGDPKAPETPPPEPEPAAKIAIASVSMIEDCPDDKSLPWRPPVAPREDQLAAKEAAAEPPADEDIAAGAPDDAGDSEFADPCDQSSMQVAFLDHAKVSGPVRIVAVRMLRPDTGDAVATLKAREPAIWDGTGSYAKWDENLAASNEPVHTSYKLSVPSWSDVEAKIGAPSTGHMFVLEVDVSIGAETQTVRSSEFARQEPEEIVT